MLVQVEARGLQAQAELLPLERVDVPGGRVPVTVDHAALALTTQTQAGPLQQVGSASAGSFLANLDLVKTNFL